MAKKYKQIRPWNQSTKNVIFVAILMAFLSIPLATLAVSSTNYIIDPNNTNSIRHTGTTSSYQLESAIEPITGSTTSTSYKLESGSNFKGYCGDGFIDPDEDCEGSNLNSNTCVTLGYSTGTLTCSSSCDFVTSSCSSGGGGGGGGGGGVYFINSPIFDPLINSFTYLVKPLIYGTKTTDATSIYINGLNEGITFPTVFRWQKNVPLAIGKNTVIVKACNGTTNCSSEISKVIYRRIVGDVNADNKVNDYDLSLLANQWLQNKPESDFNADKIVNDYDLSLMVAYWTR